jgi:hypothetical protein
VLSEQYGQTKYFFIFGVENRKKKRKKSETERHSLSLSVRWFCRLSATTCCVTVLQFYLLYFVHKELRAFRKFRKFSKENLSNWETHFLR